MAAARACLGQDEILALLDGRLDDDTRASIHAHVDVCASCRDQVVARARADDAEASRAGSMASLLRELIGARGEEASPLALSQVIDDQYRIERVLGRGGMGVVYLARDLRLDRDVAIKIGSAVSSAALGRVELEAVALARLSHPNVVVIHQVGEVDGRLYIAMEYVPGGSAREWLAARPRGWREIVGLYAAAGDGLVAAHAAGFIHRDLKPDNVLVGADDRPRVADFGLVRSGTHPSGDGDEPPPSSPELDGMTRTGTVLGTPAYMAPEQVAGGEVDARADQFAFCAAVWEALLGVRPFAGRTPAEIAASIAAGPRVPASARRRVPKSIIDALRRGLASERDERWPAMAPLVAALRSTPPTRRRQIVAASGLAACAVAAGAAVVIARSRGNGDAPCTGGPAQAASVWSPARAARIEARFAAVGAGASWPAVRAHLDDYARRWALAHRDACRATRDGSQSEAVLDRRALCLDRAETSLDVIAAPLEGGDRGALAAAPDTLELLPELDACADAAQLGAGPPLPADPAQRARIDVVARYFAALELRVARADDFEPGIDASIARAVAASASWAPLVGEAALLDAELIDSRGDRAAAERAYRDAAGDALAAGDDEHAARAMIGLADALALDGDAATAGQSLALARAEWRRLGEPTALTRRLLLAESTAAAAAGDSARAVASARALFDLEARREPRDPVQIAGARGDLAATLAENGLVDEAGREIATALADAERALGPGHPRIAQLCQQASRIATVAGRDDEALAQARRALAILEAWYGADDARLTRALEALAAATARTDPAGAPAIYDRELAIERHVGAPAIEVARTEVDLAVMEAREGDDQAAFDDGLRALAVQERTLGPASRDLVPTLVLLGNTGQHLGRLDEAAGYLHRAVALGGPRTTRAAPGP
jgi:hypothetical protein